MKQVMASLRMDESVSSEGQYMLQRGLVDVVSPGNGGKLLADGTWEQESGRVDTEFALSLPAIAKRVNHRYMPTVYSTTESLEDLLDTPGVWSTAAQNLANLAKTERFDSPWDAVIYDMIGIYTHDHYELVRDLAEAVQNVGLPFGIAVSGKPPVVPDNGTIELLETVADVCDLFVYYHYNYYDSDITWQSMQPWSYIISSVENALSFDIVADRIWLGLANYAHYWPDSSVRSCSEIAYHRAMQYIIEAGASVEWIESRPSGLVREKRATVGAGHIWFQDGDTIRPRLELVDQYGLAGMMLFAPGMGDGSVWRAIAKWKQHGMLGRMTAQKLSGCGGVFSPY